MILVTGAASPIGRNVLAALRARGMPARAFVKNKTPDLPALGVCEQIIGNALDRNDLRRACEEVEAVIHIAPPGCDESTIGRWLIEAAAAAGVPHFVYHSAIHPHAESQVRHKHKMQVESHLIDSGLPFTILQPTDYFQTIDVCKVADTGVYASPFSWTVPLSFVDLVDVAEVSAKVAGDARHHYATYQMCGSQCLNTDDLAQILSARIGRPVTSRKLSEAELLAQARGSTPGDAGDFLLQLTNTYGRSGLRGNPNVLTWLLDRPPTTLEQYIDRTLAGPKRPRKRRHLS